MEESELLSIRNYKSKHDDMLNSYNKWINGSDVDSFKRIISDDSFDKLITTATESWKSMAKNRRINAPERTTPKIDKNNCFGDIVKNETELKDIDKRTKECDKLRDNIVYSGNQQHINQAKSTISKQQNDNLLSSIVSFQINHPSTATEKSCLNDTYPGYHSGTCITNNSVRAMANSYAYSIRELVSKLDVQESLKLSEGYNVKYSNTGVMLYKIYINIAGSIRINSPGRYKNTQMHTSESNIRPWQIIGSNLKNEYDDAGRLLKTSSNKIKIKRIVSDDGKIKGDILCGITTPYTDQANKPPPPLNTTIVKSIACVLPNIDEREILFVTDWLFDPALIGSNHVAKPESNIFSDTDLAVSTIVISTIITFIILLFFRKRSYTRYAYLRRGEYTKCRTLACDSYTITDNKTEINSIISELKNELNLGFSKKGLSFNIKKIMSKNEEQTKTHLINHTKIREINHEDDSEIWRHSQYVLVIVDSIKVSYFLSTWIWNYHNKVSDYVQISAAYSSKDDPVIEGLEKYTSSNCNFMELIKHIKDAICREEPNFKCEFKNKPIQPQHPQLGELDNCSNVKKAKQNLRLMNRGRFKYINGVDILQHLKMNPDFCSFYSVLHAEYFAAFIDNCIDSTHTKSNFNEGNEFNFWKIWMLADIGAVKRIMVIHHQDDLDPFKEKYNRYLSNNNIKYLVVDKNITMEKSLNRDFTIANGKIGSTSGDIDPIVLVTDHLRLCCEFAHDNNLTFKNSTDKMSFSANFHGYATVRPSDIEYYQWLWDYMWKNCE